MPPPYAPLEKSCAVYRPRGMHNATQDKAAFPRRFILGFSVNSASYKLTCSVPLIVGGSPWLKGVWSNIPLKVPVPPEGMVLPSTLPPRTLISATTSARVPSVFHRTAPPVKEPSQCPSFRERVTPEAGFPRANLLGNS